MYIVKSLLQNYLHSSALQQPLFQCLPEWRLRIAIFFIHSKWKDMSSSHPIHHFVCCMLNCNCCGLTITERHIFLIFWGSFFLNCAEQIVMTFFNRHSGTVHKNSMRHSNKGFLELNQIKVKSIFFSKSYYPIHCDILSAIWVNVTNVLHHLLGR